MPNRPDLIDRYGFDCYLDDTEFLTRRGWLGYDAIDAGDVLATVNQATGDVEFRAFDVEFRAFKERVLGRAGTYDPCAEHTQGVGRLDQDP